MKLDFKSVLFFSFIFFQLSIAKPSRIKQKAHFACITNYTNRFKSYFKDSVLFYYHGLYTKKCSKEQRKKAKKNFRWYRNVIILLGIAGVAKWSIYKTLHMIQKKIDSVKCFYENDLVDIIVEKIDHPGPEQIKIEAAIERKIARKINEKVQISTQIALEKGNQVTDAVAAKLSPAYMVAGTILEPIGKFSFFVLKHPVNWYRKK